MAINVNCEFYKHDEKIKREINKPSIAITFHECHHRDNNLNASDGQTVASEPCNTENDFCDHRPN